MSVYTIGQLANKTKVSAVTIRYYEKIDLLPRPLRSAAGYRNYPESMILKINFINKSKVLGFTLKEIKELIALRDQGNKSSKPVRQKVTDKLVSVQNKIQDLNKLEKSLIKLMKSCDGKLPIAQCPIMAEIFSVA